MEQTTDQIVNAESGGSPTAANPNSSAAGLGQFINSTWLDTVKQHRPDLAAGMSNSDILALKNDPQIAARPENIALANQMTGAYAADNQAVLAKNGLPVTPGTTYLAHFAGPGGAVKILQADPSTPIENVLSPDAIKANPFLKGMTTQAVQAWAAQKMGATSPLPAPQSSPAAAPAPAPQAPPPAPPPIFAGQPQAGSPAPAFRPFTDPSIQAPPIFAPQQKQIDLSGLRAALASRVPIFPNPQG